MQIIRMCFWGPTLCVCLMLTGRAQEPTAPITEVSAQEMALLAASISSESSTAPVIRSVAPGTWQVGSSVTMDMALILDVAGAYFSQAPQPAGAHDPNKTGFTFQQLELSAGASVDTYFRLDTNIVFSQFGVEVEEAYASTIAMPAGLKVRLGQFLTRVGRHNTTHPHAWYFIDSMLVSGKFWGPEANRGLGVELSWLAPLPWYFELIGTETDAAGEETSRSWLGGSEYAVGSVTDFLTTLVAKQYWDLGANWGLSHGMSYQSGPNNTGLGNRSEIYATDIMLRFRPSTSRKRAGLTLQSELLHRRRQVPGDVLADWGGYIYEVWHISANWELGARQERVSGLAADYLDPQWTDRRDRYSAQLTWYTSHFSRLRLQGNYDKPAWRPEPIVGVMLGAEFTIGAHGAHAY